MKPRTVRMVQTILVILLLILALCQRIARTIPVARLSFFAAETVVCIGIFLLDKFDRCPHCKKKLDYKKLNQCPHCKEKLDL